MAVHAPVAQMRGLRLAAAALSTAVAAFAASVVTLPHRNQGVCDVVVDCGAVADNATNAAPAISACAQRCATITFPTNATFRIGSVDLSHTVGLTLQFEAGAGLYASGDPADYPLQPALPPQGPNVTQWQAVIYGRNVTGLTLVGPTSAVVDGLGWPWWANFSQGILTHQRPKLVEIVDCSDLTLSGMTFRNSPFWTLHPTYCNNVVFNAVTVLAPRAIGNTDGIDPDSCTNVVVDGCHVDVGDDGISLKSGPHDITGVLLPTANVTIQRTTVLSRNVAIGSACFGGIYNVTMRDSIIGDDDGSCPWAIKAKTHNPNGGVVSGVTFTNLTLGAIAPNTWQQHHGGWVVIAYENYGAPAEGDGTDDDDDVDARVAAWVRDQSACGLMDTPLPTRMDNITLVGINATSAYVVASLNGYSTSTAFAGWTFGDLVVRHNADPGAVQWQCTYMVDTAVTGTLSPPMESPTACGV